MKDKYKALKQNDKGFASIIIAITLVIITSLITIGFARLANTEQEQVTNRQLSNQAYYAAESGINDAAKALNEGFIANKQKCGPLQPTDPGFSSPGGASLRNNDVDIVPGNQTGAPVEWTCLLIDPAPSTLEYSPVGTTTPKLFRFSGVAANGTTPVSVNRLTFSWQDADPANTSFRSGSGISNSAFPPLSGWNSVGLLRVTITPLGILDRDALRNRTYTAYLYPTTAASSTVNYNPAASVSGQILNGGCSTAVTSTKPRFCQASINMPSLPASEKYLVSLRSVYSKTNVSISINSGSARAFGAQAKVDSTGRSQDVLKRLQVRIPARNEYYYPGFAAEASGDICKDLGVYPGFANGCGY